MAVRLVDLSRVDDVTNVKYRQYYDDFRRFQIFKGGAGAGKSFYIAQNTIYNTLVHEGFNTIALRKVGIDNHSTTFAELCKCIRSWGMEPLFDINRSKGAEEITCKVNGNQILFRGIQDVLRIRSITFTTGDLIRIWIEEANEALEEDFNQLNLRLRGYGTIPKHMILSFNPIDIDHWLKYRFFDRRLPKDQGFICESTYKDNAYLDDEYKRQLLAYKDIDYYYYTVFVLNKWGTRSTATIFHNLSIEDFEVDEDSLSNRRFGLDFGYNHANALEGVGYRDAELYIWKEVYAKHQLNSAFIKAAQAEKIPTDYTFIADSAEPDRIAEWQAAGFRNTFGVSKVSRNEGDFLRRSVNYLKSLPKIHIHASLCPNAAREFRQLKYRELKDGTVLDEIAEINDDTVAAVRYATNDFIGDADNSHFFPKGVLN